MGAILEAHDFLMAGQPRKRAMVAELEERAAAADSSTILEYVEDWVSSGGTLLQLAESTSSSAQVDITRHMVSKYVHSLPGGPEMLSRARKDGGDGLADQAIEIVDREAESKEQIASNKNAAEMRLKMAGFWNPSYQPQQKGVNVQLTFGQLHLDALRHRSVIANVVSPPVLPAGPDVEVVPDPPVPGTGSL